jgi:hypothetical protein
MKFLRAIMGKTKTENQKYTHQRRAQDGGHTQLIEKTDEMVSTCQKILNFVQILSP